MNWIKKLFSKKAEKQCAISGVRRSNIKTYCGSKYEINRAYADLVDKENIHITSVSVTRVDHDGARGYVDNYMIAISYDYYA